ncbi:AraC family transcriptional regulator [Crenobacter cavernae]|uniref:AraC family transcriptional regulator n=1 Tax=Crenobacter cavernae TaxID=2290923 RepID=UPI001FE37124|nr:AraC family transcriptional regulator [Crenobacter cavernae]
MSPPVAAAEYARFFRADDVAPLECQSARFVGHVFAPHFHEEYVVNTLIDGVQRYRYQGDVHSAGRGALVLVNPDTVHTGEAGTDHGWAYHGFLPTASFMRRLAADLSGQTSAEPFFTTTAVFDPDLAGRLVRLYEVLRHSHDRLLRESLLTAVFGDLMTRHMQVRAVEPAPCRDGVARARTLLADRLADNLTLAELAKEAGMSPYHFNRSFHKAYGLPPIAWRLQLRIARARGLLARGVTPAEAALSAGFADQSHLTRAFRRSLGVTPAAYRKTLAATRRG